MRFKVKIIRIYEVGEKFLYKSSKFMRDISHSKDGFWDDNKKDEYDQSFSFREFREWDKFANSRNLRKLLL